MKEQLEQDFTTALKAKDEIRVSALRNLKAEIKNTEIAKGKELSESEIVGVIAKKVKQHKDSIEGFRSGGREDLVEHEQKQMEILNQYLPAQMPEDEVRKIVTETVSALNAQASDFGKVMKAVVEKTRGRTDGSIISKIVKEQLSPPR